jgi:thiamine-phosphate pyrophosphorylase
MICLVTDRRRLSAGPDAAGRLVDLVESAARAGVDLIQVRERDLEARDLVNLVRQCVTAVEGTAARVLVNDRADVAVAAGAHGVHLRGDSIAAPRVRTLLTRGASVGRSVHSAAEAVAACREGALDYLIFGTLFETPSKPRAHRLATLDELTAACRAVQAGGRQLPVMAIGGMTVERAALAAAAGAAGIAAIGLFIPPAGEDSDEYLHTIVARLRRTFDTCQPVP